MIPLAWAWFSMINRKNVREEPATLKIHENDIPQGLTHYSACVVSRKDDRFVVFSTKCTHLGCRIRRSEEGLLTCPCHGSVFDPQTGLPVGGPASKPLEKLEFTREGGFLTIYLI